MSAIVEISAVKREETGKEAAKHMRLEGSIPGVYYRSDEEPVKLKLNRKEVQNALAQQAPLIKVSWGEGEENARECLLREIQYHPVTQLPIHIDLMGITRGVKIEANVPVKINGIPDGVRNSGGVLHQPIRDLDILCLPRDIPNSIEIDVTSLNIGESIHLEDVNLEGIEWLSKTNPTLAIVAAPAVAKTDEADEEEAEAGEEEVASEGAEE